MLKRKATNFMKNWINTKDKKCLVVQGARQTGKTYTVERFAEENYEELVEINFKQMPSAMEIFSGDLTVDAMVMGMRFRFPEKKIIPGKTLIFLDEIQECQEAVTSLKFWAIDNKYDVIVSGSLLGIDYKRASSYPVGYVDYLKMYGIDFEEFLYANGMNEIAISAIQKKFERLEALDESMHSKMMDLFRKFLLVGGLPDAVNSYIEEKNIQSVREIQSEIHDYYAADASKYDEEKKLKIRRIYDLIPSNMENRKKRVVAQSIENKKGKTFNDYEDEFEYLISAGIALNVQAISNPVFPLIESTGKNLLKLYLNDVGILTGILYGNNIRAVLNDEKSINLGSVYESVVASELIAHGYKLFYYDNRSKGEVDYLIDDYDSLSAVPIEVKSGKDYTVHSALNITGFYQGG